MGILRIVAWILVGLGIALIGADGISTLEQGETVLRSSREILALFGLEIGILEDGFAAGVGNVLLGAPGWMVLGLLGVILVLIFRPVD